MQCPKCLIAFHESEEQWESFTLSSNQQFLWDWVCNCIACPTCNEIIVKIAKAGSGVIDSYRVIHPSSPNAAPIISDVPRHLSTDYIEAHGVLPLSPKASAALSRRILQSILSEQGYHARNLVGQIDAVLEEKDPDRILPLELRNNIDAVRNFGNFSAHPVTDITSLQIIDVDPEEAEWCLEIIKGLFEHYYVRPAANAERLADLNEKLQQAGKPPAKS